MEIIFYNLEQNILIADGIFIKEVNNVIKKIHEINHLLDRLCKIHIVIPGKEDDLNIINKKYSNINYSLFGIRPTGNENGNGWGRFIPDKNINNPNDQIIILFTSNGWKHLLCHELIHFYNNNILRNSPELIPFKNNDNWIEFDEYVASRKANEYFYIEYLSVNVIEKFEELYNKWF